MSGPEFMALVSGKPCSGDNRCVFCGALAYVPHFLSDSFTTRDTLRCPGSSYICNGCILCLEEVGEAHYHTGEIYKFTKAFRRMCSWIVSETGIIAGIGAGIGPAYAT